MRRDIRQKILETAKELFNQHGYNAVSTRDIAEAVGISKGNLTYYFQKKEEIVEAIIIGSVPSPATEIPASLQEFDDLLRSMYKYVQNNAFYFWHHSQLAQISEKIKQQQREIYNINIGRVKQSLLNLNQNGFIRGENYTGEYDFLSDSIYLSLIYWMPFINLKNEQIEDIKFQDYAWHNIDCLLTKEGRLQLAELSQWE
jgi:AcrR family transcriptional regulator